MSDKMQQERNEKAASRGWVMWSSGLERHTIPKPRLVGLVLGLSLWFFDGLLDCLFYSGGETSLWKLLLFGPDVNQLFLRMVILCTCLVSAVLVSALLRKQSMLNERLDRINRLLKAAHQISQSAGRERAPATLLQSVCDILAGTGGCTSAFVVTSSSGTPPTVVTCTGLAMDVEEITRRYQNGSFPPFSACKGETDGHALQTGLELDESAGFAVSEAQSISLRLEHRGEFLGWFSVFPSSSFMEDEEFREILENIACEVSQALWSINAERHLQQEREAINALMQGAAQPVGDAFFHELGATLADLFGVKYIVAAKLVSDGRVKTVSVTVDHKIMDNFEYDLANTPCSDVVRMGTCFHGRDVQNRFPQDALLTEMGVESYLGTPLRDTSGVVRGLLVIMDDKPLEERSRYTDIVEIFAARAGTELGRLDAIEALSGSEQRYRDLLQRTSEGLWLLDANSCTLEVNDALCNMLGYAAEEIIGRSPLEFVVERERDMFTCHLTGECAPLDGELELTLRRKGGSTCTTIFHGTPLRDESGALGGISALVTDISERKEMEEQLRRSENRYHQMFQTNKAVKLIINKADGRIVDANKSALKFYGYNLEQIKSLRISDINTLPWDEIQREMDAAAREERVYFNFVHRLATGELRDVEVYSGPLNVEGSELLYSIVHDISERKRVERERERLMQAINQAAEAFVITDAYGAIQYVNPAFERVSGYTREEALGNNPRVLKSGKHDDEFYAEMWATLKAGETWRGRMVNRRKDGTQFTEDAVISPVRDAEGMITNFVAVKRDVSNEVQLETQLAQAQRLESIGRLAGGVAHDFNNMLAVIMGNTELALAADGEMEKVRDGLLEIYKAAERSADLTRQLLAFARRQTVSPRVLDLNTVIDDMLKMLGRLIGEDIELAWKPYPSLWNTRVDPSQIDQILVNLCVNARDAMETHGILTIETRNASLNGDFCKQHAGAVPGEYVHLIVRDTGCGMSEKTLGNVFEPFFTTKPEGEGTGLGLATTYGIIKQNKGYIDVQSEEGAGTRFDIYFPRYVGAEIDLRGQEGAGCDSCGTETIMLVEDEPAILKMTRLVLENSGYTVISSGRPSEAITLAGQPRTKIDLLISDVIMPEMNGQELAGKIIAMRPGIKVLFISGYTSDLNFLSGANGARVEFLQKPFSGRDLASKVRMTLDKDHKLVG